MTRKFLTRDHIIWELSFWSGVLIFAATTLTELVPEAYIGKVKDLGMLLGFMGKLANSPLRGERD